VDEASNLEEDVTAELGEDNAEVDLTAEFGEDRTGGNNAEVDVRRGIASSKLIVLCSADPAIKWIIFYCVLYIQLINYFTCWVNYYFVNSHFT
jgi:hypothetical protein